MNSMYSSYAFVVERLITCFPYSTGANGGMPNARKKGVAKSAVARLSWPVPLVRVSFPKLPRPMMMMMMMLGNGDYRQVGSTI